MGRKIALKKTGFPIENYQVCRAIFNDEISKKIVLIAS
jgi:hypothetical protein